MSAVHNLSLEKHQKHKKKASNSLKDERLVSSKEKKVFLKLFFTLHIGLKIGGENVHQKICKRLNVSID